MHLKKNTLQLRDSEITSIYFFSVVLDKRNTLISQKMCIRNMELQTDFRKLSTSYIFIFFAIHSPKKYVISLTKSVFRKLHCFWKMYETKYKNKISIQKQAKK